MSGKNPSKLHSCGTLARGLSYAMKQCKTEGDDMESKVAATWLIFQLCVNISSKASPVMVYPYPILYIYISHSCKAAEAYKADLIKRLVAKQKEVAAAKAAKDAMEKDQEKDKGKHDEKGKKKDKGKHDERGKEKDKGTEKGLLPQPGSGEKSPPSTPQHRIRRRRRSPSPPASPPLPAPAHLPPPSEAEPPLPEQVETVPTQEFADPSLIGKFDVEPERCPEDYSVMGSAPTETTRTGKGLGERPVAAPLRRSGGSEHLETEDPKDVTRTN